MNPCHYAGFRRVTFAFTTTLAILALALATPCLCQIPPGGSAVPGPPSSASLPPAAAQPYNEGLELATTGSFAEARDKFEEALRVAPTFAPAHYNLGLVLKSLGHQAEAADSFRRALEIDPDNNLARRFLAESLMAIPDFAAALPELDKSIESDSTRSSLFYARAIAVQNLYTEQPEKIIEGWELALKHGPKEPGAYAAANSIARIRLGLDQLDLAASAYDRAAVIDPKNPEPYYNKAVVLNRQGKFEEAIPLLKRAIELRSPNGMAAFLLAGILYREMQDDAQALEYFEMAAADPGFARAEQAATSAATIRDYLRRREEQKRKEEGTTRTE